MQIHSPEVLFFIQIAKYNSFSEAAEQLNTPQPTVSRRIIALEKTLNKSLFIRGKSGLKLTPFGEQFLHNALRVQIELENLKRIASNPSNDSNVKVEALPALSQHFIQHILPKFQQRYPHIMIDLYDISHETQRTPSNSIRLQTLIPNNLNRISFPYLKSNNGFYASAQLIADFPALFDITDLIRNKVPMVQIKGDINQNNLSNNQFKPKLVVDNALSAADAIINNLGVSWNYQVIMQKYIDDGRVIRLFEESNLHSYSHAYLSHPTNKLLSVEEEIFVNFVLNQSSAPERKLHAV